MLDSYPFRDGQISILISAYIASDFILELEESVYVLKFLGKQTLEWLLVYIESKRVEYTEFYTEIL